MSNYTSVSLVILTYNGLSDVKKFFRSLSTQTLKPEIIVIDSESTDGTQEYLSLNSINYTLISKKDFNHGETRNYGLRLATNEIVVFVTQDVIFDNTDSLELLIQPLQHNDGTVMTFGRQLPKPDATILSEFARLNNYPEKSIKKSMSETSYLGIKNCFISNSFAAYKKSVLKQLGGFPSHLIMCEDVFTGGQALLKGHKIAYVAEARVFHSHNYTAKQEFQRYFDIGYFYNSESWILKNFSHAESEGLAYLKKEIKFIVNRNKFLLIPEFIVRSILKYLGYKLGKYPTLLPMNLKKKLSMHSYYWK